MPRTPPTVTLINRVPGEEYKILVVVETRTISPIAVPAGFPTGDMFIPGFSVCDEEPLNDWLAALRKASDEKAVAETVSATNVDELRNKYSEICWDGLAQEKVANSIAGTRKEIDLSGYSLEENQQLIIAVTRLAGSSVKT